MFTKPIIRKPRHRTKQETIAKDNTSGRQHKGTEEPWASPSSFLACHSLIFKALLGVPFQKAPTQRTACRAGAGYPPYITLEIVSAISTCQSLPQRLCFIWLVTQAILGLLGSSEKPKKSVILSTPALQVLHGYHIKNDTDSVTILKQGSDLP